MIDTDVVIVGAGAAGMMCAIEAGRRSRRVVVLDHNGEAGKKIAISGGGRCNFTNLYTEPGNYLSANPHFCKSALSRYTPYDFLTMIEAHGIAWEEREEGQLFCRDKGAAQQVVAMLENKARELGVSFHFNCSIESVEREGEHFLLRTAQGMFRSSTLVIATGGLSIPKIGATSFGHRIARQFGLKLVETQAALVPFTLTGDQHAGLKALAGIAIEVRAHCTRAAFVGRMLFTHRGLSGPAMLQLSSYWQPGEAITIDLFPGENVVEWLTAQQNEHPKAELKTVLATRLPKRLAQFLCDGLISSQSMARYNPAQLEKAAGMLQQWQILPSGTEGYRTAEATCGGVDTDGLSSKTMEAKEVPGLYFIGEVVDVTGQLGGFNFQWAWASGYCAGQYV
jgi:hypothetical protein